METRSNELMPHASALLEAVARDILSSPVLGILGFSVIGVLSGILAFRRNAVSTSPSTKRAETWRTALYWVSLLPSVVWYILPFLPQTRFPSLLDGISQKAVLPLAIGLAGAVAFIWYGCCALRVVRENGTATGRAMADFLQPSHLLVEGAYARVRHPMFLYDFLAHSGLAIAAGALTTFALLPMYFALSAVFNIAEERWVLKPNFGETFERYRTRVPGYMTRGAALVLCLLALGTGFVALR